MSSAVPVALQIVKGPGVRIARRIGAHMADAKLGHDPEVVVVAGGILGTKIHREGLVSREG